MTPTIAQIDAAIKNMKMLSWRTKDSRYETIVGIPVSEILFALRFLRLAMGEDVDNDAMCDALAIPRDKYGCFPWPDAVFKAMRDKLLEKAGAE